MTIVKELKKDLPLRLTIAGISLIAGLAGSTALEISRLITEKLLPILPMNLLLKVWWLTVLVLLPSCLLFLVLWLRTRNRLFAFGVNWNRKNTPMCPSCDVAMNLRFLDGTTLRCPQCDNPIFLISDELEELTISEAKLRVKNLRG